METEKPKQGRKLNQKLKLFRIYDYLLENTDENHTVSRENIKEHLSKTHKIDIERKTIYTDIDLLKEYAEEKYEVDVAIEYDSKEHGYRVIQKDFEILDLQLLIDCVQSSKSITQKIADEIIKKLKKFASKYELDKLNRQNYVSNRIRVINNSAYYQADAIHMCIREKRKLSFKYFTYTTKKKESDYEKLYYKKGNPYIVSPYALIWEDNKYYLIAYEGKKLKHFRTDRMDNIKPLDERRKGEEDFERFNLSEYITKMFNMYSGVEERVNLRFHNRLAGVVIDRFGKEIDMKPDGDKHFTISVVVDVSPQFFGWLVGLGVSVKVISPDNVIKAMSDYVSKIADMYKPKDVKQKDDLKT